jgi:hypothetical protein
LPNGKVTDALAAKAACRTGCGYFLVQGVHPADGMTAPQPANSAAGCAIGLTDTSVRMV